MIRFKEFLIAIVFAIIAAAIVEYYWSVHADDNEGFELNLHYRKLSPEVRQPAANR